MNIASLRIPFISFLSIFLPCKDVGKVTNYANYVIKHMQYGEGNMLHSYRLAYFLVFTKIGFAYITDRAQNSGVRSSSIKWSNWSEFFLFYFHLLSFLHPGSIHTLMTAMLNILLLQTIDTIYIIFRSGKYKLLVEKYS